MPCFLQLSFLWGLLWDSLLCEGPVHPETMVLLVSSSFPVLNGKITVGNHYISVKCLSGLLTCSETRVCCCSCRVLWMPKCLLFLFYQLPHFHKNDVCPRLFQGHAGYSALLSSGNDKHKAAHMCWPDLTPKCRSPPFSVPSCHSGVSPLPRLAVKCHDWSGLVSALCSELMNKQRALRPLGPSVTLRPDVFLTLTKIPRLTGRESFSYRLLFSPFVPKLKTYGRSKRESPFSLF